MAILKRVSTATNKPSYQVLVDKRDPVTGKRNRITVGTFKLKKDAERAEREAMANLDRGSFVDPSKVTVGELLDNWLASKAGTISPNSYQDYEIAIRRHLKPALGSVKVQNLTAEAVQAAYATWRAGERPMGARMVSRCHSILSQALTQAVKRHTVMANVLAAVEKPKIARTAPNVWSPAQTAKFLGAAKDDPLHPLWYLLALEGMRRGEALGLRWKDVDLERGVAHVVQTAVPDKSNHGKTLLQPRTKTTAGARAVRLTGQTLAILKSHRAKQLEWRLAATEWQDIDLIVTTGLGTPLNCNNVSRSFARLIRVTGLPPIRVHDLRHGAATMLLRAGEQPKVVSERLGHASVGITMDLYSHVLPDMQQRAAAAMDALMVKAQEAQA
jgi:integrase